MRFNERTLFSIDLERLIEFNLTLSLFMEYGEMGTESTIDTLNGNQITSNIKSIFSDVTYLQILITFIDKSYNSIKSPSNWFDFI